MNEFVSPKEYKDLVREAWSEDEFTRAVLALANQCGWRSAHFRPALTEAGNWITAVQGEGKGFPDIVLVRGKRLIFAELKSEKGRLKPEQKAWLDVLRKTVVEVYLWRPRDFPEIETILA